MEWIKVNPGHLSGKVHPPSSKSQTLRAILFASLSDGISKIDNVLDSPDTDAMVAACRSLGAKVTKEGKSLTINGIQKKNSKENLELNAENSGIVLRFVAGAASLFPHQTILFGDASLSRRPMAPLLEALRIRGVETSSSPLPPVTIKGPFRPGKTTVIGSDSQFVSSLLIAAAFTKGRSEIIVENPGELPWVSLTLEWLKKGGIQVENDRFCHYTIEGIDHYPAFHYSVPTDFSTAAFPIAAALATQSELEISPLDFDDPQGDKELITLLEKMGAHIERSTKGIVVKKSGLLTGQTIDVNQMIDALPILAVIGCLADGETRLVNAEVARTKECNRIECMAKELKKMGANIQETSDGLIIQKSTLKGAEVDSHGDHRVAMALAVAAMCAEGSTVINSFSCVKKTYPGFIEAFQKCGASIEQPSSNCLTLFGLPKAGKSTIGQSLSEKMGWTFIDTDFLIETVHAKNRGEKKTCREIFHTYGEGYFRNLESYVISTLKPGKNTLIAVGGGAIMDQRNVDRLKQLGPLVLIDAPQKTIIERNQKEFPAYVDPNHKLPSFLKIIQERGKAYRSYADYIIAGEDIEDLKKLMVKYGK